MARKERQTHQSEPWIQNGRYILDASGWTLASTRYPDDARRIVAAVNAVKGIPTDALESWSEHVIGGPGARQPESADLEVLPEDRRSSERRRGDRRASRPAPRVPGVEPAAREGEEGTDSR